MKSFEDMMGVGERRWLAAQNAGLHQVPIVVLELNDNEVFTAI